MITWKVVSKSAKRSGKGCKPKRFLVREVFGVYPAIQIPRTLSHSLLAPRRPQQELNACHHYQTCELGCSGAVPEGLVSKGVGENWARDANINLFRAVLSQHAAVERPEDRATISQHCKIGPSCA
jgi:hypothetical protein